MILTALLCVSFGCATTPSSTPSANLGKEYDQNGDLEKFRVQESEKASAKVAENQELETIPTEINEKVEMWIKYFQGRGRPHMERYLARSTRYEALMKKVLRDNKLPEDLFYIALIESGFSSSARSHASAVGYWQFIRGTGKRYSLDINKMVDERRDPVLATQAAAEYFRDLYSIFNSWYLSMAAYNVGEGRVIKAVRKYKTKDFWELSQNKRALPSETDNYVPKYIAAKLIAKNPDKYGFEGIDYMTPIEFDHVTLKEPVNLRMMAEKMNFNYEDFKDLNPKFKGEIAPLDKDNTLSLRIPAGTMEVAMTAASTSVASIIDFVPDQVETQYYKVRRGDNLGSIARRYRTTVAYLRELNDFSRKKTIRVGQKIVVPDRTPLQQRKSTKEKKKSQSTVTTSDFYVVKRGDSLASIADKFDVSVIELSKANGIKRKSKLRAGVRLNIPRI
ncbi:LysM peptidoglycan-binding domain-containing protein [Pseudobdellovibrio sp. HCB154]|uniref:lytic transglycosylase domain-containing protein n=1 Tax=Pseudobdellovibrio sp. HCB154 TaxID=3386277 RepID=UPI003916FB23